MDEVEKTIPFESGPIVGDMVVEIQHASAAGPTKNVRAFEVRVGESAWVKDATLPTGWRYLGRRK